MLLLVNHSIFLRYFAAAALSGAPEMNLAISPSRAFLASSLLIPRSSWRYCVAMTYPTGIMEIMNAEGDDSLMDSRSYIFLTFEEADSGFGADDAGTASSLLERTSS